MPRRFVGRSTGCNQANLFRDHRQRRQQSHWLKRYWCAPGRGELECGLVFHWHATDIGNEDDIKLGRFGLLGDLDILVEDRKSVVWGRSGSVRVVLGVGRSLKKT